jgi:hypothetical protein
MRFLTVLSAAAAFLFSISGALTQTTLAQPAERLDTRQFIAQKAKTRPPIEEISSAQASELISPTSYSFTTVTAVLEDMSSGTTTLIGPGTDDSNSGMTGIGFNFYFDGVAYTQYGVNGNGLLKLGVPPIGTTSLNSIATTANAPKIMPYWDNLCVGTNGKVHAKTTGSAPARRLVVEFQNMQITRGAGCAGAGNGTFQLWLFETTGVIQFVYGALPSATADGGYSIGLQSGAATNFASVTTLTNSVSYLAANNSQTHAIAAGTSYTFTPAVPAAPTGAGVNSITATGLNLTWTDNAPDEIGYQVSRSTDNANFSLIATLAANSAGFTDSGLTAGTQYFYTINAISQGALSANLTASATTLSAGNINCVGGGGPWSSAATWGGMVPTISDNVRIPAGCTVTVDTGAAAYSVTISNLGVLQYESTTARSLMVGSDVTIDAGGTFQSGPTGTVTSHTLSLGGNLVNNGTLDLSTNGNLAGAGIIFSYGTGDAAFTGSGAVTDVRAVTAAKGTQAGTIELAPANFTVRGSSTDTAGFLTLTSGTFKISGTFPMANRVFASATYTIPSSAGFWLNNPNFTVSGQAGGPNSTNNGLLRISQGVFGIGVTGADGLGGGIGAVFIVEGGTINATRIDPQNPVSWTQTAGTVNAGPVPNTRSGFGTFELFSPSSTFNMSGGTINLIQASVAVTPIDYQVPAISNITGGVLNIGTAATAVNFNFRIRGNTPAINVDNTVNGKTATFTTAGMIAGNVNIPAGAALALNGFAVAFGGNVVNDGTITGNIVGSRFYWTGLSDPAPTYSGSGIAGTPVSPLASIDLDSAGDVDFSGAVNNLVTSRVVLYTGNVDGAGKLTLGAGGTSACTVQIGNTAAPTDAGAFDEPPVFNPGTGGQHVFYLRTTTAARSTGNEINPSRVLASLTYDNDAPGAGLTLAAGNYTVNGLLALTNGVIAGGGNTLTHNGTATRVNGYINGILNRRYTAAGAYTYHVGQSGYSPVTASLTALGTNPSTLAVEPVDSTLPGLLPARAVSRYWRLTETGDLTADLVFTYLAGDVNGNEADYRVYKRELGVTTIQCPGSPCVNTGAHTVSVAGVNGFSEAGAAELLNPSPGNVSLAGRVTKAAGAGIGNAAVIISGGNLTAPLWVQTGSLGWYEAGGLRAGETYTVTVGAKRFRFTNPTRIITLQDNVTDFNFVANPQD